MLLAGVALTVAGVLAGEVQVGLMLFFIPYLYGGSWLGALAILMVFLGILVLMVGPLIGARPRPSPAPIGEPEAQVPGAKGGFGGVVLIGPIPIVFGSSGRAALIAMAVALAVVALMLFLLLLLWA